MSAPAIILGAIAHDGCTCGDARTHIVARRTMADGRKVEVYDNGAVTGYYGIAIPGVPVARPRGAEAIERERAAAWLFADEVCLYDLDELPDLHACARRVARRGGNSGDLRVVMEEASVPRIPIRWEVLSEGGASGDSRFGALPRLRWGGVGVWHERGVYEVMHRYTGPALGARSRESWHGSGIKFTSQRELFRHLATIGGAS